MVGSAVERQGIIRHGAKMITAISEATVPKICVVVRKAYGAGLYAMAGPGFEPDATIALPTAKIAVMGAEAAVNAVYANKIAAIADDDRAGRLRRRQAGRVRAGHRHRPARQRAGGRRDRRAARAARRAGPPVRRRPRQGSALLPPPARRHPGLSRPPPVVTRSRRPAIPVASRPTAVTIRRPRRHERPGRYPYRRNRWTSGSPRSKRRCGRACASSPARWSRR